MATGQCFVFFVLWKGRGKELNGECMERCVLEQLIKCQYATHHLLVIPTKRFTDIDS